MKRTNLKKLFINVVLILGILGLLFAIYDLTSFADKKPPESVVIKKFQKSMAPVTFSHLKHATTLKIDCIKCHHNMKKEKEKMACSDCHKEKAEGKMVGGKDAFHNVCLTCHKEKIKADAKLKAPTKCTECHKK